MSGELIRFKGDVLYLSKTITNLGSFLINSFIASINLKLYDILRGKNFSFIEDGQLIKKILKHLRLWEVKQRPPPRANPCIYCGQEKG